MPLATDARINVFDPKPAASDVTAGTPPALKAERFADQPPLLPNAHAVPDPLPPKIHQVPREQKQYLRSDGPLASYYNETHYFEKNTPPAHLKMLVEHLRTEMGEDAVLSRFLDDIVKYAITYVGFCAAHLSATKSGDTLLIVAADSQRRIAHIALMDSIEISMRYYAKKAPSGPSYPKELHEFLLNRGDRHLITSEALSYVAELLLENM